MSSYWAAFGLVVLVQEYYSVEDVAVEAVELVAAGRKVAQKVVSSFPVQQTKVLTESVH